jgi:putative flippase GtrA
MIRSYLRNVATGPLAPLLRRFALVGLFTAGIQLVLLWLFVDRGHLNYLLGAGVAIEITIVLAYVLNNTWTFQDAQHTEPRAFLGGLLKTNVVRGTAIPIQVGLLYVFVEFLGIWYLIGNAVAIGFSGLYRFVLDVHWTW